LLRAVVEASTSALDLRLARQAATCPGCRGKARPHQVRRRQGMSVFGSLGLERPWYRCARCDRGGSAVEARLQAAGRARLSDGPRQWLVRLDAAPFRETAALLAELTGLGLGAEMIHSYDEVVRRTPNSAQPRGRW
jgi:hypothetical protein